MSYHFDLLLTAVNAETGEPVEDVIAVVDLSGNEEHKLDHDWTTNSNIPWTDKQGQMTYDLGVSDHWFDKPAWYLKLRKRGFEPVVVNIKPEKPNNYEKRPLPVTVRMKPIPEKP